jgi:tRNA threonylcarbamoyladenosine biosynthesis protein TsaE
LEIICNSIEDLPDVAEKIIEYGRGYTVWLLKGAMGAGKTTFITALAEKIGISDYVSSPSYSIVNEYKTRRGEKIYHFDFFRVKDIYEIFDIGIDEYIDSGDLCLIEWPELFEDFLPEKHLIIQIKNPEREKRIFNVIKHE